jgi:hypothetical protein
MAAPLAFNYRDVCFHELILLRIGKLVKRWFVFISTDRGDLLLVQPVHPPMLNLIEPMDYFL